MTTRARKLTVVVALLVIAIVSGLVVVRNPESPIVVTFARHVRVDIDDWAVIQITNRSGFEVEYVCSRHGGPVDPHVHRLYGDTPPVGELSPQGMLEVKIPMGDPADLPPSVDVLCSPVPRGFHRHVLRLRDAIGIRLRSKPWKTSLELPPLPKSPAPSATNRQP